MAFSASCSPQSFCGGVGHLGALMPLSNTFAFMVVFRLCAWASSLCRLQVIRVHIYWHNLRTLVETICLLLEIYNNYPESSIASLENAVWEKKVQFKSAHLNGLSMIVLSLIVSFNVNHLLQTSKLVNDLLLAFLILYAWHLIFICSYAGVY